MMPSFINGGSHPALAQAGYPNDVFLDELSRQIMSSTTARRLSRGSNSHRPGGAMRVVKPTSANNSPRSSIMQARRRTLMNDGHSTRRPQQLLEHGYLPTPGPEMSTDAWIEATKRSTRPVSWHPTSHLIPNQVFPPTPAQYPFPSHEMQFFPNLQQYPPTPAEYSGFTSPSSAFSPLSLPASGLEQPQYFSPSAWALATETASHTVSPMAECSGLPEQFPAFRPPTTQLEQDSSAEWNSFVTHGFNRGLEPLTPDNLPTAEQAEPKLSSEESIPFQSLADDEPEGEILIGMGLYDPPEKPDLTLENYHASVAHLLGSTYKYPESTGKGLKLEDAWEPPEMEDEAEEGDKDADGEDQDDE